jgi:hypothetical protein
MRVCLCCLLAQGIFLAIDDDTHEHHWCYTGVTLVLHWCYTGVTLLSQNVYNVITLL